MTKIDVSAYELREYAISHSWTLVKEALADGLFVLNSPNGDFTQLIFPKDDSLADYQEMAHLSISRLSEYYRRPFNLIIEEIREVNDDVISIRYYSAEKNVNSLSFQETLESIEATKQMILAAGSSVVNPVLYHKRLARVEATDLLRKTRFRHTEEGSFILKISCPVQLESAPNIELFGNEDWAKPISRKAFELINHGAHKLLTTIEEDSLSQLFDEQQQSGNPFISYNLCDSLVNLFDDEREIPFELKFNWSRAYFHKLTRPTYPESVKFPYSFKPKLNELKSYFKPAARETTDTFFGTVEILNGNEGIDGRRSGEVTLALIIENEIVGARANLSADWYEAAYRAHGQGGSFVKITGRLLPGKRMRIIDEISSFMQIDK